MLCRIKTNFDCILLLFISLLNKEHFVLIKGIFQNCSSKVLTSKLKAK